MNEHEPKPSSGLFEKLIIAVVIVISISAFVWVVVIPHALNRYEISPANVCINNLRQIDAAANQFALEHNLTNGDAINFPNDLMHYIKLNKDGKIPSCPSGGIYTLKKVGDSPTCSLGTTVTPATFCLELSRAAIPRFHSAIGKCFHLAWHRA